VLCLKNHDPRGAATSRRERPDVLSPRFFSRALVDREDASWRRRGSFKQRRSDHGLRLLASMPRFRWRTSLYRLGHHENHRGDNRRSLVVAAFHSTRREPCVLFMAAIHRRGFLRHNCIPGRLLRHRMAARRAHFAVAARHSLVLPCRRPQRRPEQHHRHQAHPRPQFSRSDRNVPRPLHSWSWQDNSTHTHSPNQMGREPHHCAASPPKPRNRLTFLDLLPPRAANLFHAPHLYSI